MLAAPIEKIHMIKKNASADNEGGKNVLKKDTKKTKTHLILNIKIEQMVDGGGLNKGKNSFHGGKKFFFF